VTDALVILPGITADRRKRSELERYFREHTSFAVHLPRLWQFLGLSWCGWQLRRYLRRRVAPAGYGRVHFLCYISGGFILRRAVAGQPLDNRGRVVLVRSPLQEQVPVRLVARYGRVLTTLRLGRMVVDLASPAKDRLPTLGTGQGLGLVLEQGVSRLAAALGLSDGDYAALEAAGDFAMPGGSAVLLAIESHDDVYTSGTLLGRIACFLESGSFGEPA
jgi:hypothetical protein